MNDAWVTGEWTGFYLERHHNKRGWMHLYLEFRADGAVKGTLKGEGTDYVGPWTLAGTFDPDGNQCGWTKSYVGRHKVEYSGSAGPHGITGEWTIGSGWLTGPFHIWPRAWGELDEVYLAEELRGPAEPAFRPRILTDSPYEEVPEPAFGDR